MFGEKNINGTSELKVTSNKKVKLPDYAFAETGDEIAIFTFKDEDKYMLLNINHVEQIYNSLKDNLKNTQDIEERKQIRNEIRHLFILIKDVCTVDKNNYIKLGENSGTMLKCKGVRKHLELEKLK